MDLIVQPQEGLVPILAAIADAKQSIDITVFRLDRAEVIKALAEAVQRGVAVRALIAHTNSSGDKALRKLELKLLDKGVTVARSDDDLVRYHGKMIIVDRGRLLLLGFNYTKLDIEKSRSLGLIVEDDAVVKEAIRLFEADLLKQQYAPRHDALVVSPENARERLASFIKGAREQLVIYDARLSDRSMIRLIEERAKAGADVRGADVSGDAFRRTTTPSSTVCPVREMVWNRISSPLISASMNELSVSKPFAVSCESSRRFPFRSFADPPAVKYEMPFCGLSRS